MIEIGSHPVWHPVFETLAYLVGFAVYRWLRARAGDVIDEPKRWTILAAAAVGALAGSRVLGICEQWPTVMAAVHAGKLMALLISPGGKTIVGGLLGGWIAVEVVKRVNGITARTGDLFVVPLCVGIAIGRIGCFVAGIADDTYGVATKLPWAVDFGDGVGRHPVQIYEIVFLLVLAAVLARPWKLREGARFGIFLASYLAWRVGIDFLKPQPLMDGLNLIQWSCLGGLVLLGVDWLVDMKHQKHLNLEKR